MTNALFGHRKPHPDTNFPTKTVLTVKTTMFKREKKPIDNEQEKYQLADGNHK